MASLYVVATPIGNLSDITKRAIDILSTVGIIVCEDTRVTQKILDKYKINNKKLIALNEFNERNIAPQILELLDSEDIALVSDAGTPLISDPGYILIREARKMKINIISIPGPSAILAALSVSGLPTDKFTFLGFLPKSSGKRMKLLEKFKDENHTIILFESPHRVIKTLKILKEIFGDITVSVSRELTKKFEEVNNLPISKYLEEYNDKKLKGEFTIVFNPSVRES